LAIADRYLSVEEISFFFLYPFFVMVELNQSVCPDGSRCVVFEREAVIAQRYLFALIASVAPVTVWRGFRSVDVLSLARWSLRGHSFI